MSLFRTEKARCPHCGVEQPHRFHQSANLDRLPAALDEIADGTFEMRPCDACGRSFRTEHRLLVSSHARRIWIVMHPPTDRPRFATLERGVQLVFERAALTGPPAVAEGLRGVRSRLVFGQHMLAEAGRAIRGGLDPVLLECTKLIAVRRALPTLMAHGPFELCFEGFADDGAPMMGVYGLGDGRRRDGVTLPADALGEARSALKAFERMHPDLFTQPYISASRSLYWGTAPERV